MKLGIIGLGLIGGTIAKSLNSKHIVSAYDISKDTLTYALENKIIHQAYDNISNFLKDNDVIYLCLYPEMIIDFFKSNKSIIKNDTLFIEISGIKTNLIEKLEKLEKLEIKNFDIVFTHPIAGRELVGVKNSDKNIFFNGNYAIIENKKNKQNNIDLTYKLAKEMGFKNISIISAQLHDELLAYTSQLTHIISLSLVNSYKENVNLSHFTGDSYRDLTRIANINIDLWMDLFVNNKDFLLSKITDFQNHIEQFKSAISCNDKVKLAELMNQAKNLHNKFLEESRNES